MKNPAFTTVAALMLTGCGGLLQPGPPDSAAGAEVAPVTPAAMPPASAATAEQFDTTTEAERQAALARAPTGERELGRTVASLGNPADPGFWLETPLVTKVTQGRVVYPLTGNSVAVELRPIAAAPGAGSRISLPAIRLLGAPLTGLPELTVYAG
ncbi:MAG: hypothetical protein WBN04_11065 [Paracoccaceae bacterium]